MPSQNVPDGVAYGNPGSALGEDVFSRVLSGGRTVILYGALATLLAYAVGGTIGLLAGCARSRMDDLLMRSMDVLLAFPPILFLLVIATGAGSNIWALVIAIAVIHVPSIARILRSVPRWRSRCAATSRQRSRAVTART